MDSTTKTSFELQKYRSSRLLGCCCKKQALVLASAGVDLGLLDQLREPGLQAGREGQLGDLVAVLDEEPAALQLLQNSS